MKSHVTMLQLQLQIASLNSLLSLYLKYVLHTAMLVAAA